MQEEITNVLDMLSSILKSTQKGRDMARLFWST